MADGIDGNAGDDGAPREFATQFVPMDKKVAQVLPFALEAIRTLGAGSAVAVGDKGIQLTLPVESLHYLAATLLKYADYATTATTTATTTPDPNAPLFDSLKFYPPLVMVAVKTPPLKPVIDALRICPPDMNVEWIELDGGRSGIAVSGPRVKAREDYFRNQVLPSLMALATQLAAEPDPTAP